MSINNNAIEAVLNLDITEIMCLESVLIYAPPILRNRMFRINTLITSAFISFIMNFFSLKFLRIPITIEIFLIILSYIIFSVH